jgi:hypothetical protein
LPELVRPPVMCRGSFRKQVQLLVLDADFHAAGEVSPLAQ